MKKYILFVDDETNVLEGLQRMLHGMRNEWEMSFAANAPEALEILKKKPFDVVVTDLFMPGMDGFEFLERVKELHPRVVRIVLSGYANKAMVLKSVGQAHQFLSKPCNAEELKVTISRACGLRSLWEDKSLMDVISRIETLPSLPALYTKVMKEINSPDGSLNRVGEIISKDAAMSAKILQLVNSSFFGFPEHTASPVRAVNLLGMETVRALIISAKIFAEFSGAGLPGYSISSQWNHSLGTGILSCAIARFEQLNQTMIDDAFMAGLLHDIGKLILLDRMPEKCLKIVDEANLMDCSLWKAEQTVLGTTHAEVGAYLIGIWGLSPTIVESIAFHHCPSRCPNEGFGTLSIVHAANAFEREKTTGMADIDSEYMTRLGGADRIEAWRAACSDFNRPGGVDEIG
jgi:HD-like signal output (HDOD) protein